MIQFSIPTPNISLEIFLAAFSVFLVWVLYRVQQFDERKRVINSLKALIDYCGEWFGTCYNENSVNPAWYDSSKSVYPVDIIQVPNLMSSNLLSPQLTKQLSYFIELVRRFNYRIEVFNNFVYSDPAVFRKSINFIQNLNEKEKSDYLNISDLVKKQDEDLRAYLDYVYFLQKVIHVHGIGDNTSYNEKFPKLHKCFNEIKSEVENEIKIKNNLFRGRWYFFLFDILFFCLPLLIIVLYIVDFLVNKVKITF